MDFGIGDGSDHLAQHEDAAKTALQMGHTSNAILFNHYRDLVDREEAAAYGVFDSMKALYPDGDIPPGDISNCHKGQVLPDGSVTLSLLGGTEYLIHLANGKCYGIG